MNRMKQKEHFRNAVWTTPFHERTSALNTLNEWHRWKDYTTADAYFDVSLEYAAIRNACAVFDLTPMTKHRITGPDALAFLNRLVTRDVVEDQARQGGLLHLVRRQRPGDRRRHDLPSEARRLPAVLAGAPARVAGAFGVRLRRADGRRHPRRRLPRLPGADQLRRAQGHRLHRRREPQALRYRLLGRSRAAS